MTPPDPKARAPNRKLAAIGCVVFVPILVGLAAFGYAVVADTPWLSAFAEHAWRDPLFWAAVAAGCLYPVHRVVRNPSALSIRFVAVQAVVIGVVASVGYALGSPAVAAGEDSFAVPTIVVEARFHEARRWSDYRMGWRGTEAYAEVEGRSGITRRISLDGYAALEARCGQGREPVQPGADDAGPSPSGGRTFIVDCRGRTVPTYVVYRVPGARDGGLKRQNHTPAPTVAAAARTLGRVGPYPVPTDDGSDTLDIQRVVDAAGLFTAAEIEAASEALSVNAARATGFNTAPINPLLVILSTDASPEAAAEAIAALWGTPRRYDLWAVVNLERPELGRSVRVAWVTAAASTGNHLLLKSVEDALGRISDPAPSTLAAALMAQAAPGGRTAPSFLEPQHVAEAAGRPFLPWPAWLLTLAACWGACWAAARLSAASGARSE